jgi:hypothetical protein
MIEMVFCLVLVGAVWLIATACDKDPVGSDEPLPQRFHYFVDDGKTQIEVRIRNTYHRGSSVHQSYRVTIGGDSVRTGEARGLLSYNDDGQVTGCAVSSGDMDGRQFLRNTGVRRTLPLSCVLESKRRDALAI